jgi:Eukaryotic aspartyl protease
MTLDGYTAWIESEIPWIGLPDEFVNEMHSYMDAHQLGWSPIFAVDCGDRWKWRALMFVLGGEEFRMSLFDYTLEGEEDEGHVACYSLFLGKPSATEKTPNFALGAGFLRGFETVFDLERNMVGCEYSHRWDGPFWKY